MRMRLRWHGPRPACCSSSPSAAGRAWAARAAGTAAAMRAPRTPAGPTSGGRTGGRSGSGSGTGTASHSRLVPPRTRSMPSISGNSTFVAMVRCSSPSRPVLEVPARTARRTTHVPPRGSVHLEGRAGRLSASYFRVAYGRRDIRARIRRCGVCRTAPRAIMRRDRGLVPATGRGRSGDASDVCTGRSVHAVL